MLNTSDFIEFQEKIGNLKHLRRTGWVVINVPFAETVAAHSWRMALMAICKEKELQNLNLDVNHIIELCIVHDISESVVGDIIPYEHQTGDKKISKEEKHRLESEAINEMSQKYGFEKLKTLFEEYEAQESPESVVVKNLDKIDMILQAYEYLTQYPQIKSLNEFIINNEKDVKLPIFQKDLQEIKSRQFENKTTFNHFIDFQILAGKLKHLERSGPKMYGIKNCETVASHCFRTSVMALYLEDELQKNGLDVSQIIRTAIIHDIGESIIGDIVPEKWQNDHKISNEEKYKKENEAILNITNLFNMPFILEAFINIEQRKTPEASVAKDLEIFECIQQAYEYIKIYPEKAILREYIPYNRTRIKSDLVKNLINAIKQKQDNFLTERNFPTFYEEDKN